jgi:hypothetical protein
MKIRVVLEIDLDKHIGVKYSRKSTSLGFSLLHTVFKGKVPTKIHADVLKDYGVEVKEIEGLQV